MNIALHSSTVGRTALYATNLLVSFHYFIVVYINSAFLSDYISTQTISVLYLVGSVLSVFLFIIFPKVLSIIGNYWFTLLLIALEILALAGLALELSTATVIGAFLLYLVLSPTIYLNLDIFLEKFTQTENATGGIRGVFLTMQNITQVAAPLLVGALLFQGEYGKVYVTSIAFLTIAFLLVSIMFKKFSDPRYVSHTVIESFLYVFKNKNLNKVFFAQILLRFFYAWMVIYTPLYLFENVGLSWSQIGTVFSVMLVPFLLLELPLGKILDIRHLERFFMAFGFLLMVGTVACIPSVSGDSLIVWMVVLFLSRVGAACVEMTTESYFFRHVDGALADTISLFRMTRPFTYVIAAMVAGVTLHLMNLQNSFFVLAAIMVLGIPCAMALRVNV